MMKRTFAALAVMPALLIALSGCAQLGRSTSINQAAYDKMSCAELNAEMKSSSEQISRLAIRQGDTAKLTIPNWLLGGKRAVAALNASRQADIERLRQEEAAIDAGRRRNCS